MLPEIDIAMTNSLVYIVSYYRIVGPKKSFAQKSIKPEYGSVWVVL